MTGQDGTTSGGLKDETTMRVPVMSDFGYDMVFSLGSQRGHVDNRFAGVYRKTLQRHNDTFTPRTLNVTVVANPDGSLRWMGETYAQTSPTVYEGCGGREKLIFHEDEHGTVTSVVWVADRPVALERVA